LNNKTFNYILYGIILGLLIGLWFSLNELNATLNDLKPEFKKAVEIFDKAQPIKNHIKEVNPKAPAEDIAYYNIYLSRKYNIDTNEITGIQEEESHFKIGVVSPKGARDLMQVMPATFRQFGHGDYHNWMDNTEAGVAYLAWLKVHRKDTVYESYNAGCNHPYRRIISRGYRVRVLRNISELEGVEG
jgi:soluble lytic murein transglycosylase-like protein